MSAAKHFKYLATANDTATVAGPTVRLHAVIVGTGAASATVTIYNNTSATGDVVTLIDASGDYYFDFGGLVLSNMHAVLAGGNAKVTIVYS